MDYKTTNNDINAYINSIKSYTLLTAEEEKILADLLHNGNNEQKAWAKNMLITSNLRLVVDIADDYKDFCSSLCDLIAAGNQRLMEIVEDFDPQRYQTRFSTFAYIRIKDAILKEVDKFIKYTQQFKSFEEPVSEGSDIPLGDTLKCSNSKEWWEGTEQEEQLQLLEQVMQQLDERDQKILTQYYYKQQNLTEIAKDMNLSRQRVSQLCERAFARLQKLFFEAA